MKKLVIILTVVMLALPSLALASTTTATDSASTLSAPVNINLATAKELTALPGVGKVTAERIVVFREANGPFSSIDDLTKVKGIGNKTLAKIRDRISLD